MTILGSATWNRSSTFHEKAVNQVAFGGNDYGLDGFHFDLNRRNLYLLQFKNSTSAAQFKDSFERLTD